MFLGLGVFVIVIGLIVVYLYPHTVPEWLQII